MAGLLKFDREVLRHYHFIALAMAAVNLFEAIGLFAFTVDGLAWFNLVGAATMGVAWPLHESIVRARKQRAEQSAKETES